MRRTELETIIRSALVGDWNPADMGPDEPVGWTGEAIEGDVAAVADALINAGAIPQLASNPN